MSEPGRNFTCLASEECRHLRPGGQVGVDLAVVILIFEHCTQIGTGGFLGLLESTARTSGLCGTHSQPPEMAVVPPNKGAFSATAGEPTRGGRNGGGHTRSAGADDKHIHMRLIAGKRPAWLQSGGILVHFPSFCRTSLGLGVNYAAYGIKLQNRTQFRLLNI